MLKTDWSYWTAAAPPGGVEKEVSAPFFGVTQSGGLREPSG
jgi:hypothetical protein